MYWYSWLMIAIVIIGILYMIADKFILPVYRYHKNKQRAATYIWCTFFHPSGSVPQRMLCRPVGAHFIEPPKEHLDFFPKLEGEKNPPKYCLIGTEIIGQDNEGNDIEQPVRLTQRDVWPPGANATEQVFVEAAYFIVGRQEALNPYRNFMAANTELAQLIIREERSMEAANLQTRRELENWENLESGILWLKRNFNYVLIGIVIAIASGVASAIISYMGMKA